MNNYIHGYLMGYLSKQAEDIPMLPAGLDPVTADPESIFYGPHIDMAQPVAGDLHEQYDEYREARDEAEEQQEELEEQAEQQAASLAKESRDISTLDRPTESSGPIVGVNAGSSLPHAEDTDPVLKATQLQLKLGGAHVPRDITDTASTGATNNIAAGENEA